MFVGGGEVKGSSAKKQREMFYSYGLIYLADSFEMKPKPECKVEEYKLPSCQYKQKQSYSHLLHESRHFIMGCIASTIASQA